MDAFRSEQKKQCPSRGTKKRKRGCYGCECCMPMSLSSFKVMTRKLAKARFREETKRMVREAE